MTKTAGNSSTRRGSNAVRSMLAHGAGILLVLALLPACLAVGIPFAAWAIAASLVVFNRAVHALVAWSVRDASLTMALGAMGFSTIFRALLTALTLFFVGASVGAASDTPLGFDRPDLAVPALLIFMLCFTLDAGIEALRRTGEREAMLGADQLATTTQETPA